MKEDQPIMLAGAGDIFDAKNFSWIEDIRPMPMWFETWPKIIKEALYMAYQSGFSRTVIV